MRDAEPPLPSGPGRTQDAVKTGAAAAFFAIATAAYTWPLPLHVSHAVPHDSGDPLLVTWLLWWSTHTVPLTQQWWNAPAFFPSHGVFAFSETLLGLAPVTAPFLWLGKPPLVAYNVAFLASFFLSALAAYFLGFVLTGRHAAAVVAGAAFGFSPYRLSHLGHLQLLAAFWMPLGIAALHLYARDGRRRWAVIFGLSWLMQTLTSGYYFFFFSFLVAAWLLWFASRWPLTRLATIAMCWLIAGIVLLPLFAGYKRIQSSYGFHRAPSEIAFYSADIAGVASAASESRFWHALHPVDQRESQLFPGVTILLVVGAGALAYKRQERSFWFYVMAASAMWLLALGPHPAFMGRPLHIVGPYRVLMLLPGIDGIRVPARLWMIAVLCFAAAAAIYVSRIQSSRRRTVVAVLAVAGLLLDGWPSPITLGADPGMPITHTDAVARLGLPLQSNETETMYGAIAESRPVFNGYSGYTAPQHYALADLLEHADARVVERLASHGPIEVIIRRDLDPGDRWLAFASSLAGATRVMTAPAWTAFRVPASTWRDTAPTGTPLPIAHLTASVDEQDVNAMLDGDLDSRWHARRQAGGETIVADLGRIDRPSALVMSLGVYASQYPRVLQVSTSMDGAHWETAWVDDTALATYDAAVRSPRQLPVTVPLPRREARYIRLSQIGNDPDRGWSIVELGVTR